jgi:hypothetical protein
VQQHQAADQHHQRIRAGICSAADVRHEHSYQKQAAASMQAPLVQQQLQRSSTVNLTTDHATDH